VINDFPNDSLLIPIGVRPMHPGNELRPVMRTFGTFDALNLPLISKRR